MILWCLRHVRVIVGEALLTPEQRVVHDKVGEAENSSPSHLTMNCAIDEIGGSGKTFTYSLLQLQLPDRSQALT